MRRTTIIVIIISIAVVMTMATVAVVLIIRRVNTHNSSRVPVKTSSTVSLPTQSASIFAEPVADFKKRVTKKPFGIYITPQNSPVRPECFSGYHTGADAEYEDVTADVPVFAIADCIVVLSETASGYGGVFMVEFDIDGAKHTALYGHIRPSSLPQKGDQIYHKGD